MSTSRAYWYPCPHPGICAVCTQVCLYACLYACLCPCLYPCLYACLYPCPMSAHMHTHASISTSTYMSVRLLRHEPNTRRPDIETHQSCKTRKKRRKKNTPNAKPSKYEGRVRLISKSPLPRLHHAARHVGQEHSTFKRLGRLPSLQYSWTT